jgi:hypothetical protein
MPAALLVVLGCPTKPNPFWTGTAQGATEAGSGTGASSTSVATQGSSTSGQATGVETDPVTSVSSADFTEGQSSGAQDGPWWNLAWGCRREIVIHTNNLSDSLDGFPLLVDFAVDLLDPSSIEREGADMRFVDDVGRDLEYEIERFDADLNQAIIWVRIEQFQASVASQSIYLYYCNEAAPANADAAAVWDLYSGVFHFSGAGDSTGINSIAFESVSFDEGLIASALRLDGNASSFASIAPGGDALEGLFAAGGTLCAAIFLDTFGENGQGRIADKANNNNVDGGWTFNVDDTEFNSSPRVSTIRFARGYRSGTPAPLRAWEAADNSIAPDAWYFVCVVFDESEEQASIYIDGDDLTDFEGLDPGSSMDVEVASTIRLGRGPEDIAPRWYDGMLDELRFAKVLRTPQWIELQARSIHRDLIMIGDQETPP